MSIGREYRSTNARSFQLYRTRYCSPALSFVIAIIGDTCWVITNSARKQLDATVACSPDLAARSFSLFSFRLQVRRFEGRGLYQWEPYLHVCACICTSSVNSRVRRTPRWLEQLRAVPITSMNRAEQTGNAILPRSIASSTSLIWCTISADTSCHEIRFSVKIWSELSASIGARRISLASNALWSSSTIDDAHAAMTNTTCPSCLDAISWVIRRSPGHNKL